MSGLKLINIIKENKVLSLDELDLRTFLNTVKGDANALKGANGALHGAIDDVLKFAANDKNQIVGLTAKSPNQVVKLTSVDDFLHAIRTPKGIDDTVLGLFNQGLLKSRKTPAELIDGITIEVVKTKNFKNRYAKLTDSEMRKSLKAAGYSDNAVDSFMKNAKKDANFKKAFTKAKAKRSQNGKNKNMSPKGNGSNVNPQQKKTLAERGRELLNMITVKKMSWKQLLAWGAGIGVGGLALWWYLFDNNIVVPDDTPETEPGDTGEWAACIKELLDSKEARITTFGASGLVGVSLVTAEYPEGLNFFSNGRVADVKTKKKGSWKCKGTKAVVAEQVNTMAEEVEILIDLLDFPVTGEHLVKAGNLLKKYVTNGKGKEFLSLYQRSGFGDGDLGQTLKYIKTTEASSVQAKDRLVKIYSQILSGKVNEVEIQAESKVMSLTRLVLNEQSGKVGISKIDIKWDGETGTPPKAGETPPKKGGGVSYKDCSSKDFPFEFGCISPKIAEIQGCLGITPQKGYFGPKTKRTMEPTYDLSGGITKEIYDAVKAKCGGAEAEEAPKPEGLRLQGIDYLGKKIRTIDTSSKLGDLSGKIKPIDMGSGSSNNGEAIYKMLQSNYGDGSSPEFPYIFSELGRLKYKGESLDGNVKDQLSQYVETLGYREEPIKDKDKSYGVKYVWVKQ